MIMLGDGLFPGIRFHSKLQNGSAGSAYRSDGRCGGG